MFEDELDYCYDGVFGFKIVKTKNCSSGKLVEIYSCDDGYCHLVQSFDSFWIKGFKEMATQLGLKKND